MEVISFSSIGSERREARLSCRRKCEWDCHASGSAKEIERQQGDGLEIGPGMLSSRKANFARGDSMGYKNTLLKLQRGRAREDCLWQLYHMYLDMFAYTHYINA